MKKILFILYALAASAMAQTTITKNATNVVSNGPIIIGNGNSLTTTGNGTIVATSGNATAVPWTGITGKPTTVAGFGITDAPVISGGFTVGLTATANTAVTLPTTGTLLTTAGAASAYQPLNSGLTAIAALTTTSYGRSTLSLADAAAGRTYFGVVIGANVQAWSAALDTFAANGSAYYLARANQTGTQAAATITGLAAVATSGSASDLVSGTVPTARLPLTGAASLATSSPVLIKTPAPNPMRLFQSKLISQGSYIRRAANGYNTNFTTAEVVRLATFGDSMARLKAHFYNRDMWDAYGFGGMWTLVSDAATFQISSSGDVVDHTAAGNPNGYDYTAWITGEYRDLGPTGMIWTTKSGNTYQTTQVVDTIGVSYLIAPGAGSFKIQSSENGMAWVDEPGYTSVSANGTLGGGIIVIPKTRISEWDLRVVSLSGRVKVGLFGKENRTTGGFCSIDLSRGGLNYPDYNTASAAVINPILAQLHPHAITVEWKELPSDITTYLPTTISKVNTAVTSTGEFTPDWVFIYTSPSTTDDAAANAAMFDVVNPLGYQVWDGYSIGKDYATMLALGWLTVGDGTHPTYQFSDYAAGLMTTDLHFFDGASARTPSSRSSQSTGFKNRFRNGRLDFWSAGTSFVNSTGGNTLAVADNWIHQSAGGYNGSSTISRQTFTPGDIPDHSQYYIRVNQTVAASTSDKTCTLTTATPDVYCFAGQGVTLSFWARASAPLTTANIEIFQYLGSGGSGDVTVAGFPVTLTTSWKRFVMNGAVPMLGGKTVGAGGSLQARFNLGNATSTYTIDIWGVQLEAGLVATNVEWTGLGTMANQNSTAVAITGGTATGLTALGANNAALTGTTTMTGNSVNAEILSLIANASQGNGILSVKNSSSSELFRIDGGGNLQKTSGDLQINAPSGQSILMRPAGSEVARFTTGGMVIADANNIAFSSTTGTKHGTSASQKQSFYNSTPIAQPAGNVFAAVQNLGLVSTVTAGLTTTTTLDFPSIAANGGVQDLTVTVTGAAVGQAVQVNEAAGAFIDPGISLRGIVTSTNTVTVRATNSTTGAIDPLGVSLRVTVQP